MRKQGDMIILKKITTILLAIFLVFVLAACGMEDYMPTVHEDPYPIPYEQEYEALETEISALGLIEAHVTRVIDGDTIEILTGERVRLIGVDAPETGFNDGTYEVGATEATEFVKSLIEGQTVWLETDGNDRDRHDRLRRYVWLQVPTDTQDEAQIRRYQLNAMLLENGYADILIVGNVRNETLFRQLATAAPVAQPTPDAIPVAVTTEPVQPGFIGNRNSQIFHNTTCNSLPAPQNRIYFETREAAVNAGHRPCERCRP